MNGLIKDLLALPYLLLVRYNVRDIFNSLVFSIIIFKENVAYIYFFFVMSRLLPMCNLIVQKYFTLFRNLWHFIYIYK